MKQTILIIIAIFATANMASGHGFGQSLEKMVDNYIIDVGFDAIDLVAGEPIRLNIVLWNKDRTETPEFTDAWVHIAPADGGIVFAGNLHQPEYGSTGMTFIFPDAGDYELTVRFQSNDKTVVEASFPLKVGTGVKNSSGVLSGNVLGGTFLGFIAGCILIWFLRRKKI